MACRCSIPSGNDPKGWNLGMSTYSSSRLLMVQMVQMVQFERQTAPNMFF